MSELFVLALKTETGASKMLETIGRLQKQELITLEDAAMVVRPMHDQPKVKQAQKKTMPN